MKGFSCEKKIVALPRCFAVCINDTLVGFFHSQAFYLFGAVLLVCADSAGVTTADIDDDGFGGRDMSRVCIVNSGRCQCGFCFVKGWFWFWYG